MIRSISTWIEHSIEKYVSIGSGVGIPDPVRGGVPQEDAENAKQGKQLFVPVIMLLKVLRVHFIFRSLDFGFNTWIRIQNSFNICSHQLL